MTEQDLKECIHEVKYSPIPEPSKEKIINTLQDSRWIPCSERLPEVEKEVLICAVSTGCDGKEYKTITTALYEDGTVSEVNSCWVWMDIDGEWDEENDCLIIPKGWWEYRHFNPDEVYNNVIDKKVVAWMPLPEPYKESED